MNTDPQFLASHWGVSERAAQLHSDAYVCELVLPIHEEVGNHFGLVERFAKAGYNFVSFTIAGDDCGIASAIARLALARARILREPERYVLVESVADIRRARATNRIAVGLHFEGNTCLERKLEMVSVYYSLGVRHNLIAFNRQNDLGSGCIEEHDCGLSAFGKQVVIEMRRVGMLLDLSHTGCRTTLEAMEIYDGPVIFSHSMPAGVHNHFRNITDGQIRMCAAKGGLVGMSGSSAYQGVTHASIEAMIRHIDYVAELVGPSHIGLGLDLCAEPSMVMRYMRERPEEWFQDGHEWAEVDFVQPESVPQLTEALLNRGYSERDVRGILGENFIRVAGAVWK
jgi:membrane dipeptidase